MGQVHSDEYGCDAIGGGGGGYIKGKGIKDVGDSELNTQAAPGEQVKYNNNNIGGQARAQPGERQQRVRKLSNVSHRNIQLLSMKPRSEKDAYADDLRTRRRSSLINLILGAPSSGPRFCDDLCSLSSHLSELYFGIESFPDPHYGYGGGGSTSTLRLASIEDSERDGGGEPATKIKPSTKSALVSQKLVRRSSIGSLAATVTAAVSEDPTGPQESPQKGNVAAAVKTNQDTRAPSMQDRRLSRAMSRNPSLASTLASIDLTSSFEQHQYVNTSKIPQPVVAGPGIPSYILQPPFANSKQQQLDNVNPSATELVRDTIRARQSRARINQTARMIRRSGSELSLYSTISASSAGSGSLASSGNGSGNGSGSCRGQVKPNEPAKSINRETELIILLQVALPFILAGFGNMAAGLVLDLVSRRQAFVRAPILFVLLPPLIGLKGNIEMTLASRISTLSNLNLLQTSHQRWRAYASNLTLVISQAIGLSLFAVTVSLVCELSMVGSLIGTPNVNKFSLPLVNITLAVFASALTTTVILVIISSIVMSSAVALASLIQVNPDNLSTLIAALYGDVSCVFFYGLVADWMFGQMEKSLLLWPSIIVASTLLLWPISLYLSYKFKETHKVALYSMPPMIISIMISMGSGALLSIFIGRFRMIALYQPVVNGFGANLVAVQASRVSTWLWCSALGKLPLSRDVDDNEHQQKELPSKVIGTLASFAAPKALDKKKDDQKSGLFFLKALKVVSKSVKLFLWSFCNSSPNAIAARLLLIMLIPAHTIYFLVIWLLSPTSHVVITWQFYLVYIGLCLVQVFILLTICEPFMTLLMSRNMDPDVFGISILMAVADLTGTICLTLAFFLLSSLGDVNALQ